MLCSTALWCFVYKYLFLLKVFFSSSSCTPLCMQWSGSPTHRSHSSPRLLWVCWAALLSNRLYLSVLPQLQLRLLRYWVSPVCRLMSTSPPTWLFCYSKRSDSCFVFSECCTSCLVSAGDRNLSCREVWWSPGQVNHCAFWCLNSNFRLNQNFRVSACYFFYFVCIGSFVYSGGKRERSCSALSFVYSEKTFSFLSI